MRDRVERGETLVEARAAAAKEFGNVLLVKDVTRKTWGWERLESAAQDLRYALRRLEFFVITLWAALTINFILPGAFDTCGEMVPGQCCQRDRMADQHAV